VVDSTFQGGTLERWGLGCAGANCRKVANTCNKQVKMPKLYSPHDINRWDLRRKSMSY
jgi:hypothetical protein